MPHKNLKQRKAYLKEHYLKNKDKIKAQMKDYYLKNKDKAKEYNLIKYYNLTLNQYNKMLADQNSCCKVCGVHASNFTHGLYVDHNHKTNKIRSLLCTGCNAGLGHLKEDINIMKKLIKYIKEHNE